MKNKKVTAVVLGGHGFVGRHVVAALEKSGHTVFAASRADGVDLLDYTSTEKYLNATKPDVIFNCAAHVGSLHYVTTFAAQVFHDNVQMGLNLYRAAAQVCPGVTIVNPLSNCSYPGTADVQVESEWLNGPVHDSVLSYGSAKRTLYTIAASYAKQYKIKSINFLAPNTFGPGDAVDPNKTHALNGMIIRMIEAKQKNLPEFEIWGTGKPIREWAYVDDVVAVMVKSIGLEADLLYPVNIGQNKGYTIRESAEFIAAALGYQGKLVFNTKYQDGASVKILDDKKFRSIFPDYIFSDHQKGVAATVEYYQSVLGSAVKK